MWFKRILISIAYSILHNSVAILGLPILGVTLLFVSRSSETLPKLFRLWDNGELYFKETDDPDGLMGPKYYREERGTLYKYDLPFFKVYWERFNWLALRNPADYLKYLLGPKVKDKLTVKEVSGTTNVGDHIGNDVGTYKLVVINGDGKEYWEYYTIKQYPFANGKYIFRLRLGWKIKDPSDDLEGKRIPFEFSITPIKTRR